jgi:hypothetical protein
MWVRPGPGAVPFGTPLITDHPREKRHDPCRTHRVNAGIKAAINAAQITALTIETGKDAGTFRKKVAAEALAAFAESARG